MSLHLCPLYNLFDIERLEGTFNCLKAWRKSCVKWLILFSMYYVPGMWLESVLVSKKRKKLLDVIHSLEVILHFNCNFLGWFSGMMPKFFFIISYVHFKLHNQTDFMWVSFCSQQGTTGKLVSEFFSIGKCTWQYSLKKTPGRDGLGHELSYVA